MTADIERPLLMSAPMVRALLAGTKSQTRRIGQRYRKWKRGDRVWVRETYCFLDPEFKPTTMTDRGHVLVCYRADHHDPRGDGPANPMTWRPSIFMPRWASRITLEMTEDVRYERLQAINGEDAIAEGISVTDCDCEPCTRTSQMCPADQTDAIMAYAQLWDSLNAKKPGSAWNDNPEVIVLTFRILTP